jgi:hypothetical protein
VRCTSWFALAACALALASCVSPEELRREDEATCGGYGFHAGTDAFATVSSGRASRGVTQFRHHRRLGHIGDIGAGSGAVLALTGGVRFPRRTCVRRGSGPVRGAQRITRLGRDSSNKQEVNIVTSPEVAETYAKHWQTRQGSPSASPTRRNGAINDRRLKATASLSGDRG